jgi:uncharacterized membrane protein YfcA
LLFDLSPWVLVFIGVAGFVTAVIGGVAGIGTAIAMIPVMTFAVGVREAIPIVAIAVTLNSVGRIVANRHFIDYRVVLWFSIGAVPTSFVGGALFASAPAELLARGLAIFLIALVAYRHMPIGKSLQMRQVKKFGFVGLVQGFLSSIFGGAGPFGAHFFLSYGLYRQSFVGTVALATSSINLAKTSTYASYSLLDRDALALGLIIGVIMIVGAYFGGRLVNRLPDRVFVYIVEGVMLTAAGALLIRGYA